MLSLAPHHSGFRDVTQGAANVGYTTPAYVSMDQPRAVSLFFSSGLMEPKGLVQVDVTDNSTQAPVRMSLSLQYMDGSSVVLDGNGLSSTRDAVFYQAGSGTQRLAAQFDARTLESQSLKLRVVVRSWFADDTFLESTDTVRVGIVNGRSSSFGQGWAMAGLQRLRNQSNGVYITDGGTGLWFPGSTVAGYTSPDGEFSRMRWDAGAWVRDYPNGSSVRFSGQGYMLSQSDRFGNVTSYTYDTAGRLTAITDPTGQVTTLGYTPGGVLGWVQDPMGRRVTMTTSGTTVWRVTEPDNSVALTLGFAELPGRGVYLDRYWDKAGNPAAGPQRGWQFGYDMYSRLSSITAPEVSTTDAGVTRPVTQMKSLEVAVLPTTGTGRGSTPTARVQPAGIRVEATDARGNATRMAIDRFGAPTLIEEPLGRTTRITRDIHGRAISVIAPSGDTSSMKFVGEKLVRARDHSSGRVLDYEYFGNLLKRVVSRADTTVAPMTAAGDTTVAEYEYGVSHEVDWKLGRLYFSQEGPEAHYYSYDAIFKHLVDHEWGPGGERHYWYNAMANMDSVREASGGVTSFTRDAYGRVTATRLRKGSVVRNDSVVYDVLNRVEKRIDPAGSIISYTYSGDRLIRVDDPRGLAYGFEYNALGLPTKRTYPDGGSDVIEYDRSGNITRRTDRRNQTVTFTYDALAQLTSRTADGQTTRFRTDPAGRFQVAANSESTDSIHFKRAGNGREVTAFTTRGTGSYSFVTSYDRNGVRGSVRSLDIPSGYIVDFEHEGADHGYVPNGIIANGLRTSNIAEPFARYRQLVLPTGDSIRFDSYSIRYSRKSLDSIFGETLTWDVTGRMNSRRVSTPDTLRTFGYNLSGRLISTADDAHSFYEECRDGPYGYEECDWVNGSVHLGSRAYTYDTSGNPTHTGATLGVGNRLSSFNGYTLSYDAAGNLVSKSKPGFLQTLDWNSLGQVTRVVTNGVEVTFGYDGYGRRVRKTVTGVRDARYLYDGQDLVAELNGAGYVLAKYYFTPGVDNPHMMERGGTRYYYLRDSQGSVVGLVDSAGNLTHRYKYDPFGASETAQESFSQPFRYTAREYDAETGLYFYRARYYDAQLQRFISQDPIGLAGGINPYSYAGNDPVNNNDPSGLAWQCWTVNGAGDYKVGATIGGMTQILGTGPGQYCFDDNPVARTNRELRWRLSMLGGNMSDYGYGDPGSEAAYLNELEVAARLNEVEEKKAIAANSITNFRGFLDYVGTDQYWADVWANLWGTGNQCGTQGADPQTCYTVAGMPSWISPAGGGIKFTTTVANHADDLTKAGLMARPYMRHPALLIDEIMKGRGRADPGGVAGALRWDAPGMMNGSRGTWELVVDMVQNRVMHFVFRGGR